MLEYMARNYAWIVQIRARKKIVASGPALVDQPFGNSLIVTSLSSKRASLLVARSIISDFELDLARSLVTLYEFV